MAKSDTATQLSQSGTQPSYFTMMPNMAIRDLSPIAYKLLAIYLDMTETGEIYARNKTISDRLGMSINSMKKARKELADKGYIVCAVGKDGKDTATAKIAIQIDWMWSENKKRSNSDKRVSNSDTPPIERVSNSDTNKQDLNITDITIPQEKKKESADEPQGEKIISPFADTSYQGIYAVIADKSFGFGKGDKIPKAMSGRIGRVVKAVRELEPIPSVAEVIKAYAYYQEMNPDGEIPKGETTVVSIVQDYRKSADYRLYESHKEIALNSNQSIDKVSSAPPSPDNPPDWKPSQEWIDAQPDYATPEEVAAMRALFEAAVNKRTSKKLIGKIPPQTKVGA